jgi:hypothetical protein
MICSGGMEIFLEIIAAVFEYQDTMLKKIADSMTTLLTGISAVSCFNKTFTCSDNGNFEQWAVRDLNPRPFDYQSNAPPS